MADSPIDGNGFTIQQLFSGRRFSLDYYQREYSWSRDSVKLLLGDLQRRFLACWRDTDDRQATARYDAYFLGPYVYHDEDDVTYLVDGQQRITTLHLLLIYIYRLLIDQELNGDAAQLQPLIYKRQRGRDSFTIDIPERHGLLDSILNERPYDLPANCSPSLQNLYERNRDIDELYPEELRGDALPYFYDWLLDRVCLVGIRALSRDNAWEIFESMNDRGVRLGPVDLLKSHLLSKVDPSDQRRLNTGWRTVLSRLNGLDTNAASDFIKTVLTADYSEGADEYTRLRGGSTPFHEWVRQNQGRIGLNGRSDFTRFTERLLKLSEYYQMLAAASGKFDADARLHALFYNQYNNLSIQLPLIFAAIRPDDTIHDVKNKAELIAKFVDLVYILTVINNAASLTRIEASLSELIPDLRNCQSIDVLTGLLGNKVTNLPYNFSGMDKLSLHQNVRQVRYLLARLTTYVDTQCGGLARIDEYLDEKSPYEIEHIWAINSSYRSGQKSVPNFEILRNRVGALLLLPKSGNASLGDLPYEEKLKHYRRENMLAASLHPDSHSSRGNPGFKKFLKRTELGHLFRPFDKFGAHAIDIRQQLYRRLCELIWSPGELGIPGAPELQPVELPARRPRTHYGVELSDLIDVGAIEAGTTILGSSKKVQYAATVLSDGRIRVETGETFGSLSGAGQFVRGTKSCPGWSFWNVQRGAEVIPLDVIRKNALNDGLVESRR